MACKGDCVGRTFVVLKVPHRVVWQSMKFFGNLLLRQHSNAVAVDVAFLLRGDRNRDRVFLCIIYTYNVF